MKIQQSWQETSFPCPSGGRDLAASEKLQSHPVSRYALFAIEFHEMAGTKCTHSCKLRNTSWTDFGEKVEHWGEVYVHNAFIKVSYFRLVFFRVSFSSPLENGFELHWARRWTGKKQCLPLVKWVKMYQVLNQTKYFPGKESTIMAKAGRCRKYIVRFRILMAVEVCGAQLPRNIDDLNSAPASCEQFVSN